MVSGMQLNFFPAIGGVSTYYSPQMIRDQMNLDYAKHCTTPFGAYLQANHESNPHNMNVLVGVDYEDEDEDKHKEDADKDEEYEDNEELKEAASIDPGHVEPERQVDEKEAQSSEEGSS